MTWKEAKVNLAADGGLQHSLVFGSDMVTENLRCAFSSQFDVISTKTSFKLYICRKPTILRFTY